MVRLGLAGLAIGAALAAAACTSDASSGLESSGRVEVEKSRVQGHTGRFAGAITHPYTYSDPGFTMTRPPASARPDVPWSTAFQSCFSGPIPCVTHGDADVSLAVVTGPGGAIAQGRRMFEHAMTYVVVWDAAPCVRPDLGDRRCHVVNLITAMHGNVPAGTHLYTFEIPTSALLPTASNPPP